MDDSPNSPAQRMNADAILALQAQERRFRQMVEQTPSFQFVADLATNQVLFCNHETFLGHAHAALAHLDLIAALVHPSDRPAADAQREQVLRGLSQPLEYRMHTADGEWEWVQSRLTVITQPDGTPCELATSLRIVTERHLETEHQAQHQRRMELLVRSSGQIIYDYTVATGEIVWDGALEAVLGYELSEMEGGIARWGELIHDEDAMEVFRLMEQAERECTVFQLEYRLLRKDGGYAWVADRGFFLPGQDGKAERMLGIMQDITERREVDRRRTEAQELLIATQQATLRELSTPLIPLRDDVLVMPLIGALDPERAQQILRVLLEGVQQHRAIAAILDITGVSIVDTQVANVLIQAAQAVQLLGAQVVLTGIRPEVAQTLVGLGVSLDTIITRSTLQAGIATVERLRR